MNDKKIESFEYIFLTDDGFSHKKDTRKRNDIITVRFCDGSEIARIYLNNVNEYVDIPKHNIMLNEIAHITWTKDSENGLFVKSDADEMNLKAVLMRYNKDPKYTVHSIDDEEISQEIKRKKRLEFIGKNPYANTENPSR